KHSVGFSFRNDLMHEVLLMQSLSDILLNLGAWNWLILAVILFVLESFAPGIYFAWFGVSATVVGILALNVDVAWQWQLIIFAMVACGSVFIFRQYTRPSVSPSDEPDLNERTSQYVGRVIVIEEAIAAGRGRARIGDSLWSVEGPDIPRGGKAKVVGTHGTVLIVEPVQGT
ncbi:MAG: NfeD family protein, partial [Hyphomicrobiaceae bacterium]